MAGTAKRNNSLGTGKPRVCHERAYLCDIGAGQLHIGVSQQCNATSRPTFVHRSVAVTCVFLALLHNNLG